MDEFNKTIEEYTQKLPLESQAILKSTNWKPTAEEIGKKYSLDDEQIAILQEEILFVLIGVEEEDDLQNNLEVELNISEILAGELYSDVKKRIIALILNKFKSSQPKVSNSENSSDDPYFIALTEEESVYKNNIPPNLPTEEPLPADFLNNKLNSIVVSKKEETPMTEQTIPAPVATVPENRPTKSYVADPYREPTN